MPRQARLDFPGCLHHIINRGIERKTIFLDKQDYQFFVDTFGKLVSKGQYKCYAWVLMPNHFHLLVETSQIPMPKLMARLQTRYAGYFNKKYSRTGRLFQNRYKSIVCDKDTYLTELIAYIHLNPLRAGLVGNLSELAKYRWSGHRILLGDKDISWYSVQEVLPLFGSTERGGRNNYLEYLSEKKDVKKDLSGGGLVRSAGGLRVLFNQGRQKEVYDSRVLGDGAFVESILNRMGQKDRREDLELKKVDFPVLVKKIANYRKIEVKELSKPGKAARLASECRALLAYLGVQYSAVTMTQVSDYLRITPSATSRLYRRGEMLVEQDPKAVLNIVK